MHKPTVLLAQANSTVLMAEVLTLILYKHCAIKLVLHMMYSFKRATTQQKSLEKLSHWLILYAVQNYQKKNPP